jgi:hypothetical protein
VIGRVDPLARTAFGGLCLAALLLEAIPVLLVVGVVGGVAIAIDGNFDRALWVWLGSWAASLVATALFLLAAYVFWPLASDWITEWQGYVAGFVIGGCGLAFMASFVFITDFPLALEVLIPLAVTFLVGFFFPGRLLGLGRHSALPQEQAKAARRR